MRFQCALRRESTRTFASTVQLRALGQLAKVPLKMCVHGIRIRGVVMLALTEVVLAVQKRTGPGVSDPIDQRLFPCVATQRGWRMRVPREPVHAELDVKDLARVKHLKVSLKPPTKKTKNGL